MARRYSSRAGGVGAVFPARARRCSGQCMTLVANGPYRSCGRAGFYRAVLYLHYYCASASLAPATQKCGGRGDVYSKHAASIKTYGVAGLVRKAQKSTFRTARDR